MWPLAGWDAGLLVSVCLYHSHTLEWVYAPVHTHTHPNSAPQEDSIAADYTVRTQGDDLSPVCPSHPGRNLLLGS